MREHRPDALRLRLRGEPTLTLHDGRVRALEPRAAALLALVAVERELPRARAAELLWPESAQRRVALRQQIVRFRRAFGVDLLVGTERLQLAPHVAVDLVDGAHAPLLGDLRFHDQPALDAWLVRQRALDAPTARAAGAAASAQALAASSESALPATLLRPPRLVGRAAERMAVEHAWSEARAVLLLGEAGLGKSRLLAEVAAACPAIVVAARPGDEGVPYGTLARVLRQVIVRCTVAEDSLQRTTLARLLPELAPGAALPAEAQRLALQHASEALLRAARLGGAPLAALVVDDLHFADEASVEMLQALIGALHAELRFALAQRPGEGSSATAALRATLEEAGLLTAVELAPLGAEALAALVDSLHLPDLDAARLAGALAGHTGGNPLFVLETIKQGLASGQLRAGELPRPASVAALIERRLALLSPRALALARVAAVAGVDFDIALAEHATGASALALADPWRELQSAQVLQETAFAHDLVADAVLRAVPDAIGRELHGAVARWLQAHDGEPARIAQHRLDEGNDAEAVEALEEAAERARGAGRAAECGRFLQQAAWACDRVGDAARAFELMYRAADALSLAAPIEEFAPIADELEHRARTDAQWAAAHLARAHVLIDRNALHAAAEPVAKGLAAASRAGRRDLEAELTFGQVHLFLAVGDLDGACDAMERALSLFRAAGMHRREADKLMSLGTLQSMTGRVADALATFALARERFDALALGYLKPVLLSGWAVHALFAGDGPTARRLLDECDALLQERGVDEIGSGHLTQLVKDSVLTSLRLGEPGVALARLERARQWPGWQPVAEDAEARVSVGSLMLELGRPERVGALFEPLLKQGGFSTNAALARICTLQQAPEEAAAFWAATPDLARAFPPVASQCLAVVLLAEHAPVERALGELARLLARAEAQGWHGARVALLATQAAILARAGCTQEAREAAQAAADLGQRYTSMCSPAAVALSCAEAFERCGDAAQARTCLRQAHALVRSAAAQLPDEFGSSYQLRNPVVRAVLECSARAERLTDQSNGASWLPALRADRGRMRQGR